MSKATERILQVTHFYRFLIALDFATLLHSPSSITYTRACLSELAGGEDFKTNEYLFRFKLPSNASTRIYTLGAKGRSYLAKEMGLTADWYFRPHKLKYLSHSQADHNLSISRFLISAQAFASKTPNYRIAHIRICYELAKTAPLIEITTQGKTESLKVIPDAWILFEKLRNGAHERFMPVLLELDRGTEHQLRFKQHLRSRIAFIQTGAYRQLFHTNAVVIAYVTTGQTPEYPETRRRAISAWTNQILHELGKPSWASIFRICSTTLDDIYHTPFFDQAIWYTPDSQTPVPLFTS
ncbi:MAG: replication-relaxation family protein [Nitrososphaerales archaeon]